MDRIKTVIQNSSYLVISNIITKLINFFILIILTGYLGAKDFGLYSFAFSFTTLLLIFSNLGINTTIVKELAADPSQKNELIGSTASTILIFSFFTIILINLLGWFGNLSYYESVVLLLMSFYVIIDALSRYLISIFRAFEKMHYEAILILLEKIGLLVSSVAVMLLALNLTQLMWFFILVSVVKTIVALVMLFKNDIKLIFHIDFIKMRIIVKRSLPFALITFFISISMKIDVVMLKWMIGDEAAGIYSTSKRIFESLLFLPENISVALFPILAATHAKLDKEFYVIYKKALRYLVLLTIPIVIIIFVYAPFIIQLLFDAEYYQAYIVLRWLSLAFGAISLRYLLNTMINSVGLQSKFSIVLIVSTVINVIMNYILIPNYFILGAAIATIISEYILLLTSFYLLKDYLSKYILRISTLNYFLLFTAIGLVTLLLANLSMLLSILFFIVSYCGSLFAFNLINLHEIKSLLFLKKD